MLLPYVVVFYGCITSTVQSNREISEIEKESYNLEYILLDEDNQCRRTCVEGRPAMLCNYTFDVEWYHTLSKACFDCPYNVSDCFREDCVPGDGTKRGIVTVNRKIPGPSIEVCQSDIIIVDVVNKMISEATTIHWHGQTQKQTPYMDGVPFITQCPILPFTSFRYTFEASQAGTHFWHSHMGMQRVDGAFGPLVVRVPRKTDPHSHLYDYDLSSHTMVITDWETELGAEMLLSHFHGGGKTAPPILLINGLGRYREFKSGYNKIYMPTARFKVSKGYRYRFRIINAGSLNCPIELTVDKHIIEVISTDGNDIEPIKATSLITYSGERFDFILHANQDQELYWIKFKGLMNCGEKFRKTFQVAVLEYDGVNNPINRYPKENIDYFNSHNDGILINPLNKGIESTDDVVVIPKMKSIKKWDDSLKVKPDFQYYVGFDFYNISNEDFHREPHYGLFNITNPKNRVLTPQFNHISMLMPSISLLSQRDQLAEYPFCNNETITEKDCTKTHCQCLHGIKIPLNAIVEFVFVDEGLSFDVNHPLHLHGYDFRVVSMERVGNSVTVGEVRKRDAMGLIHRNLIDAPLKDTVTVPDGGYTIVRFKANNPGYWVLHCHIEVHMALGMSMILQVGEKHEMIPVPKNFPKCGNYIPDVPESLSDIYRNRGTTLITHYCLFTTIVYILYKII